MPTSPRVILLIGNDEFAMARRIRERESEFSDSSSSAMNIARLDGHSMSEQELNNAVNALPFLASRRLVVLTDPSARYSSPDARRRFCEFLENTPESALILLSETNQPRDLEKHWLVRWARKLDNLVSVQTFMLPNLKAMDGWILREVREQGGQIETEAAHLLAGMIGADTRQASQEIAKLLAFVNWSRQIRVADVEAVSIVSAQQSIFDFVDSLASGDAKKAQALLKRLLETEESFSLWGMVIRQFRLLLLAREILDGRGTQPDVERLLNLHSFVAEKITSQTRRFSIDSLEFIYHRLLETDEGVKTGRFSLELALEMLVIELAQ